MAERYPEVPLPLPMDPIEARINEKFNQLIDCLNRRREQLIAKHRERQAEKRAETTGRIQTLRQLTDTRTHLQTQMKENVLHSMRDRIVEDIETKMRQLEVVEREVELTFECDTRQLEETISVLGQLVEREIIPIPNYPALLKPQISVGERGTGQGELKWPEGIAFDERTQLIYVADGTLLPGNGCIIVFSVTGEYINTFCEGQLEYPMGIVFNGDEVYVSDSYLHSIFHFKLPGFQLITKVGKEGTGKGEFSDPHNLTVAPNGSVFIADKDNNRIVVMTQKLEFQQTIKHTSMTQPCDVKLLDNKVFVLSSDNPCLHVFSHTGEKLRSFITCGTLGCKQVKQGYFFCFDKQQNILISDFNSIKVFSQEGALLHTLGHTQEREKIIKPMGIVVTNDNKIICSSCNTRFGLHIFC